MIEKLPEADPAAIKHSAKVFDHVARIISEEGGVPFSRYMNEVLYAPGLGYYAAGAEKFGAMGDFVTAPEVSQLFASCIAEQASQVLKWCGGSILELGAGSGELAVNIISVLKQNRILPETYAILESSAELQFRQKAKINRVHPDWRDRIVWLDSLATNFTGFIFGNEVMDAFPVERFVVEGDQILQLYVNHQGSSLCWQTEKPNVSFLEAIRKIEKDRGKRFEKGYTSEVNLLLGPWVTALAEMLNTGAIVLLDYGYPRREYYLPERAMGTLRCYFRHHAHDDPLIYPGIQDITSHVDFTALVDAAVSTGLELDGFTSQAQFLFATHLLQYADSMADDSTLARSRRSQQIQQLTLPGAMGEMFSAIGFSKGLPDLMLGFTGHDYTHRL